MIQRETSIHRIEGGSIHPYPKWYYESKDKAFKSGICFYCGIALQKTRGNFCSEECRKKWVNWASIRSLKTTGVRREVHKKFGFACTKCGLVFSQRLPSGIEVPRFYGNVHHIVPLENGGSDVFDNLTLLCRDCHKIIHQTKQ
jgi:hypothetical protein